MKSDPIVIIGASLAGASAAWQLREEGHPGPVVLIGEEPHPPYERPPLSKAYLRGEVGQDGFAVHEPGLYAERDIDLRLATHVAAIEPASREVVLDDGARVGYDHLLIATGSRPRRLDVPGNGLPGVHALRRVDDSDAIREAAATASRAVVVGSGWIGSEVAASLRQLGVAVTLVSPDRVPLQKVLGEEVGAVYHELQREHGVEMLMGDRVAAFRGSGSLEAVETAGGRTIEADLAVVGIGAEPRVELAVQAGLEVEAGILVDERLESSAPGIYAAGDIAEAWHPVIGERVRVEHWDNAKRQGAHAARTMLGSAEPYVRQPYFFSDQYDLSMEYRGFAPTWDRVVFRGDPASREFIAFWLAGGRVVAAMNANVRKVGKPLTALIQSRAVVATERLEDPSVPLEELAAPAATGS
jgi:3-phenylpropionate/trans-cinnamate dioxygenase ferredoxin reductase subunit